MHSLETTQKFIKLREVTRMTGLSPASLYRLAREGRFPRPVKLGERASAWIEHEVTSWISSRITDRDAA